MALDWQTLQTLIGVELEEGDCGSFQGVASLGDAAPGDISFLGNSRYEGRLATTKASLVLVPSGDFNAPPDCRLVKVANPSQAFSKVIAFFQQQAHSFRPGVSSAAIVADSAIFDSGQVQIGPGAVIEEEVNLGDGTVIGAGCLVGARVRVGRDCHLHSGSIVREDCLLGDRVILQPGCVVGSDGYGFELKDGRHEKVPQVGNVEIENDVEVGANSCIDRARFGTTRIGEGSKIDNLVQIAHNVRLGRHCLVVAQSGIAGSSTLGDHVTIAAQAGVAGHLEIADQTVIATRGGVLKDIRQPGVYTGLPARPIAEEQKKRASLSRIPKMRQELKDLKKKLEDFVAE